MPHTQWWKLFSIHTNGFLTFLAIHLCNMHYLWGIMWKYLGPYLSFCNTYNYNKHTKPCRQDKLPLESSTVWRSRPDSFIVQHSKWKQFSLGINPKISPTLSGERATKRVSKKGIAIEGQLRGRLGEREWERGSELFREKWNPPLLLLCYRKGFCLGDWGGALAELHCCVSRPYKSRELTSGLKIPSLSLTSLQWKSWEHRIVPPAFLNSGSACCWQCVWKSVCVC